MSKTRIMIVDDQEQITRLVKMSLESTGDYEVREENNGLNAISTAKDFNPELIFLDVMLPDISGAEIANQMLDDSTLKNIKIVFLTSIISKQETNEKGGEIAGRKFLAKPVNLDDLTACIEEQLSGAKS